MNSEITQILPFSGRDWGMAEPRPFPTAMRMAVRPRRTDPGNRLGRDPAPVTPSTASNGMEATVCSTLPRLRNPSTDNA